MYLTSMHGGVGLQDAGSPFTRVKVFARASVQATFHPKHSKLRPRSRKMVVMCFSMLPYIKTPYLDLGKNIVKWLGQCFSQTAGTFSMPTSYQ